jgi:hypothetical protein
MEMSDEVFEKEINNLDKIDKSVESTINNMATVFKMVVDKLKKDNICYISKEPLKEDFEIVKVPEEKLDKGIVAFVAVNKEK